MMRKYYRNRHATFMRALLDKKKNEQLQIEEQKVKEERKKKKVRDKVLAQIGEVVQADPTPIEIPVKRSTNSVIGRAVRSSSMSVQLSDDKKFIKAAPAQNESTTISSQIPSSKEDKKRAMKEVYGFTDENIPRRKLNRQSSRSSVRSSHSVQTPITTRKDRFASGRHQPGQAQVQVMPSLKKQNPN